MDNDSKGRFLWMKWSEILERRRRPIPSLGLSKIFELPLSYQERKRTLICSPPSCGLLKVICKEVEVFHRHPVTSELELTFKEEFSDVCAPKGVWLRRYHAYEPAGRSRKNNLAWLLNARFRPSYLPQKWRKATMIWTSQPGKEFSFAVELQMMVKQFIRTPDNDTLVRHNYCQL